MKYKFSSETERKNHPQAGLIPYDLWWWLLKNNLEFSQAQVELMQTPLQTILENQDVISYLKEKSILSWICIASANTTAPAKELLQLAIQLDIKINDIVNISSSIGNKALIEVCMNDLPHEHQLKIIRESNFSSFQLASANGHIPIIMYFAKLAPDLLIEMIKSKNYFAYRVAARFNQVPALEYFESEAPEFIDDMIRSPNDKGMYGPYHAAASEGHVAPLEHIGKLRPHLVKEMIRANNYAAFFDAAMKGHIDVVKHFLQVAPDVVKEAIDSKLFKATYRNAVLEGSIPGLNCLEALSKIPFENLIKANSFSLYIDAAASGQLQVMKHFEETAPHLVNEMLKAERTYPDNSDLIKLKLFKGINGYDAFHEAAKNVLKIRDPKEHNEKYRYLQVTYHLMSHPSCFAQVELFDENYGESIIHPFITERIANLRHRKSLFELNDSNATFDISDPTEIKTCFYMAKNLIRRNSPDLLADLNFLLQIPAVKAIANSENCDLLRMSIQKRNIQARELLMDSVAPARLDDTNPSYAAAEKVLDGINFDMHLSLIREKAEKYKDSTIPDEIEASKTAELLHKNLETAKSTFLHFDCPIDVKGTLFKEYCLLKIAKSEEILKNHRGWKETLAQLASAICSVLSFGLANYFTGVHFWGLFPTNTDSVNRLSDLKEDLKTRELILVAGL